MCCIHCRRDVGEGGSKFKRNPINQMEAANESVIRRQATWHRVRNNSCLRREELCSDFESGVRSASGIRQLVPVREVPGSAENVCNFEQLFFYHIGTSTKINGRKKTLNVLCSHPRNSSNAGIHQAWFGIRMAQHFYSASTFHFLLLTRVKHGQSRIRMIWKLSVPWTFFHKEFTPSRASAIKTAWR